MVILSMDRRTYPKSHYLRYILVTVSVRCRTPEHFAVTVCMYISRFGISARVSLHWYDTNYACRSTTLALPNELNDVVKFLKRVLPK